MMSPLGYPLGGSSRRAGDEGSLEKTFDYTLRLCLGGRLWFCHPLALIDPSTTLGMTRGGLIACLLTYNNQLFHVERIGNLPICKANADV